MGMKNEKEAEEIKKEKKMKCPFRISNMARREVGTVTAERSGEARGVTKGQARQGEAGEHPQPPPSWQGDQAPHSTRSPPSATGPPRRPTPPLLGDTAASASGILWGRGVEMCLLFEGHGRGRRGEGGMRRKKGRGNGKGKERVRLRTR